MKPILFAPTRNQTAQAGGPHVQAAGIQVLPPRWTNATGCAREAESRCARLSGDVRQVWRCDSRPKNASLKDGSGSSPKTQPGWGGVLLLRKRKTCAAQAGTRDDGDNCGEHNCRHSQVHMTSASTDINTQLTRTRRPGIRTRADDEQSLPCTCVPAPN